MNATKFEVVGKTTDGKLVVIGMFEFLDRFGLPTEMFCLECKDEGCIPDWLHFCLEAKKANWSSRTIIGHVREGASVWGKTWADCIAGRVSEFIKGGL